MRKRYEKVHYNNIYIRDIENHKLLEEVSIEGKDKAHAQDKAHEIAYGLYPDKSRMITLREE